MRASGTPRVSAATRSPIRRAADLTVPGEGASRPSSPGAVELPDTARAFLAIVAAHDHVSAETFLTGAICRRLEEIGLSRALDLIDESSPDAVSISPASTSPSVATDSMLPASDGAFYSPSVLTPTGGPSTSSGRLAADGAPQKCGGLQSEPRPAAGFTNTPSAVTDRRDERREGCSGDAALPATGVVDRAHGERGSAPASARASEKSDGPQSRPDSVRAPP